MAVALDAAGTDFVTTGLETNPDWFQLDLKFNYRLNFTERLGAQFFLDVYNITNNEAFIQVEAGHNAQEFRFQDPTVQLTPRRVYLGTRLNF